MNFTWITILSYMCIISLNFVHLSHDDVAILLHESNKLNVSCRRNWSVATCTRPFCHQPIYSNENGVIFTTMQHISICHPLNITEISDLWLSYNGVLLIICSFLQNICGMFSFQSVVCVCTHVNPCQINKLRWLWQGNKLFHVSVTHLRSNTNNMWGMWWSQG